MFLASVNTNYLLFSAAGSEQFKKKAAFSKTFSSEKQTTQFLEAIGAGGNSQC